MKQEIFKGLTKKGERWNKLLLTAKETHILNLSLVNLNAKLSVLVTGVNFMI